MMHPHYHKPPLDPFAQKHAEDEKARKRDVEVLAADLRADEMERRETARSEKPTEVPYKPVFPV